MLGESFRDGKEHYTHSRLIAYLERKGKMEYAAPVLVPAKTPNRTPTASLLVGQGTTACRTCKRCIACGQLASTTACTHTKAICPCPFPRRMVPWGKVECQQDKEACERLQHKLAMKMARGEITMQVYHTKYKWITGMMRKCDSKLFAVRQRMIEAEGAIDPKRTANSIGRNVEPMGKGLVLG
jgi:hypothetical protein